MIEFPEIDACGRQFARLCYGSRATRHYRAWSWEIDRNIVAAAILAGDKANIETRLNDFLEHVEPPTERPERLAFEFAWRTHVWFQQWYESPPWTSRLLEAIVLADTLWSEASAEGKLFWSFQISGLAGMGTQRIIPLTGLKNRLPEAAAALPLQVNSGARNHPGLQERVVDDISHVCDYIRDSKRVAGEQLDDTVAQLLAGHFICIGIAQYLGSHRRIDKRRRYRASAGFLMEWGQPFRKLARFFEGFGVITDSTGPDYSMPYDSLVNASIGYLRALEGWKSEPNHDKALAALCTHARQLAVPQNIWRPIWEQETQS